MRKKLFGKDNGNYKHGLRSSEPRLYNIWNKMMHRCYNPKCIEYKYYGSRGIHVCAEWHDPINFVFWAKNNGYLPHLTIDRIDNNSGYIASNCRWATRLEQNQNTRKSLGAKAVSDIRGRILNGELGKDIANIYDVNKGTISLIKRYVTYPNILQGLENSIKSAKKKLKDVNGLTIIEKTRVNKHGHAYYIFECYCGNKFEALRNHVTSGNIKSCGCFRRNRMANLNKKS